jgi:hypothetical protein
MDAINHCFLLQHCTGLLMVVDYNNNYYVY